MYARMHVQTLMLGRYQTKISTSPPRPTPTSSDLASSSASAFMSWEKQNSTARLTSAPPHLLSAAAAHSSWIPMPSSAPTDSALSGTTMRLAAPEEEPPPPASAAAAASCDDDGADG